MDGGNRQTGAVTTVKRLNFCGEHTTPNVFCQESGIWKHKQTSGEIPKKSKIKPAGTDPPVSDTLNFKSFPAGIIAVLGSRPRKRPLAIGAPAEPSGTGRPGTRPAGRDLHISRDLHNSPTHAHVPDNTTRGTERKETGAAATARDSGALGRELIWLVCYGRRGARSSQMPGERWTAGRPRPPLFVRQHRRAGNTELLRLPGGRALRMLGSPPRPRAGSAARLP